ncbi:MAG TPA: serine hydrolase domain-containing protein [Gemmatimonadales bacterium]
MQASLDALVAAHKAPGIQYLVVDAARTLCEHAAGWADIARRVPMSAATTLMGYSMSKTITAAAALQLAGAGRIGLDDPVDRYVSFSPYGPGITVRQLLSHTSGIPNPIPLRWVHLTTAHDAFDEDAALRAELQRHPRLASAPGSQYAYSNLGYWLLGSIVQRAGGQPFTAYVSDHVLRPIGASPSELGYRIPDLARHANGYLEKYSLFNLMKRFLIDRALVGSYEGRWLRIHAHYANGPAFGGLVGSARGFGKFLQDQLRPRSTLFNDDTRALFYAPQHTTDGTPVAMTLGWHIGSLDGEPFFYKEGGGGGFHAMMRLYPSSRVGTVVMTNATGCDVKRCLDSADRQFLAAA